MSKIELRWEVEDGYVGKARPQTVYIDLEDMAASCDTEDEAIDYLEEEVRIDFENRVSYYMKNRDEVIAAWLALNTSGEQK